jgi:hypothetical protein
MSAEQLVELRSIGRVAQVPLEPCFASSLAARVLAAAAQRDQSQVLQPRVL